MWADPKSRPFDAEKQKVRSASRGKIAKDDYNRVISLNCGNGKLMVELYSKESIPIGAFNDELKKTMISCSLHDDVMSYYYNELTRSWNEKRNVTAWNQQATWMSTIH